MWYFVIAFLVSIVAMAASIIKLKDLFTKDEIQEYDPQFVTLFLGFLFVSAIAGLAWPLTVTLSVIVLCALGLVKAYENSVKKKSNEP